MDPNQQQQGNVQNEDYVDKGTPSPFFLPGFMCMCMYLLSTGLDFAEKKFGQGKVDPAKMRSTNEKITDGARNLFEKATGYVPFASG